MPFNRLLRKISGQNEINNLLDFYKRLDSLISKLEQEFADSKLAEQESQKKYSEKLSKLDFNASKQAVEEGRRRFAKSLDLDVQLEFLKNIRILVQNIPDKNIHSTKQLREFNRLALEILDLKKICFQSNRRMIMNRFKKFVPLSDEILSLNTVSNIEPSKGDVEKILSEIKDGISNDNSVDNDVEAIIKEIRKKKDFKEKI